MHNLSFCETTWVYSYIPQVQKADMSAVTKGNVFLPVPFWLSSSRVPSSSPALLAASSPATRKKSCWGWKEEDKSTWPARWHRFGQRLERLFGNLFPPLSAKSGGRWKRGRKEELPSDGQTLPQGSESVVKNRKFWAVFFCGKKIKKSTCPEILRLITGHIGHKMLHDQVIYKLVLIMLLLGGN